MSKETVVNRFQKAAFYDVVGGAIREARESADLSVDALAQLARLHRSTVDNAEQGFTCSLYVMRRIADALDVLIDELVPVDAPP